MQAICGLFLIRRATLIFITAIVKNYYDVSNLIITFGAFFKAQNLNYGKRSFRKDTKE